MNTNVFVGQLYALIAVYVAMQKLSNYKDDLRDQPAPHRQSLITRSIAAIRRISGDNSTYSSTLKGSLSTHPSSVMGVVQALRDDLDAGYVQSLVEIAHADVFSDFLDMATHLLEKGYKDAAAVIIGSTLESHLKKLASKSGVALDINGRAVKAESLNQELARTAVYGVLEQKSVTAWLDLRNKAAHGEYDKYDTAQVKLLLASVQDFMVRNPA